MLATTGRTAKRTQPAPLRTVGREAEEIPMATQPSSNLYDTINLDDMTWFQANRDKLVRYRTMNGNELNAFYDSARAAGAPPVPRLPDGAGWVLAAFLAEAHNPGTGAVGVAVGYFPIDLRLMKGARGLSEARSQVKRGDPHLLMDVLVWLADCGDPAARTALATMVTRKEVPLPSVL